MKYLLLILAASCAVSALFVALTDPSVITFLFVAAGVVFLIGAARAYSRAQ